ncbi:cytochrome P450 [Hypoxylon argillaceum]|nr:cytochrome P450 [Hypoxylon argillaceum]
MELLRVVTIGASYAPIIAVLYGLLIIVYRLFFHPLNSFPGPFASRLSDLYGAYFASRTALHRRTHRDHIKYGPVIRHGPNKLVFNSVSALQAIYQNDQVTKSRAYLVSQRAPDTYSLWNALDQDLHRSKRKIIGQVVSERSMKAFEPTMMEEIDTFIRLIFLSTQAEPQTPINMTERCKWLGIDIVGHLSFAYPLNLQTDPMYRFIIDSAATANYFLNINMQMPPLAVFHAELFIYLRAVMRGKSYLRTIQKMIKARLAKDKHAEHDFYSLVTEGKTLSKEESIWTSEIWSEAIFFLTAGGDTTPTGMSALFFYLARNPRCYQRLAEEIRATFGTAAEIRNGPKLASCSYLRACFDEALRMSPPTAGTLWRQQVVNRGRQPEPLVVDGHVIPPGTQIGVNIYSIHHNEQYFPRPFTYLPERWLPGCPEYQTTNRNAFIAFSTGPRGCAGKAMAYLEASLVIAKTLWYFDFEEVASDTQKSKRSEDDEANEYQLNDIVVSTHDGPWLRFSPRAECKAELGTANMLQSVSIV